MEDVHFRASGNAITLNNPSGIFQKPSRTLAPIALFVYNRPRHTRRTIEALKRNTLSADSEFIIFSDASKDDTAIEDVQAVREYLHQIDGFKSVTVIERDKNFGLANSIIDGVRRLTEEYGRVIVLEDDLITSPYFLEYMNSGLDRYESESKVMQIAGYMFPVRLEIEDDALFLPFISSWGWATWQRAWRHFDPLAAGYQRLLDNAALRRKFDLNGNYRYFRMLQAQQMGKAESWAIRWYLSVFLQDGLTLYPRNTLVNNLGFDGTGVNCSVSKVLQDEIQTAFRVTRLPQLISVSAFADVVVKGLPRARPSIVSIGNRITGFLRRLF